jgi:hypothetical protein
LVEEVAAQGAALRRLEEEQGELTREAAALKRQAAGCLCLLKRIQRLQRSAPAADARAGGSGTEMML